jgi:urease accessory protein
MKYILAVLMCVLPGFAWAHAGHGLVSGALHPLTGWDHLVTLAAAGVVLSATPKGDIGLRLGLLALCFSAAIGLGVWWSGHNLEWGITLSFVALGLALLTFTQIKPWVAQGAVLLAVVLHGGIHGTELPFNAQMLWFGCSLTLSSIGIIAVTWGISRSFKVLQNGYLKYSLGAALVVLGCVT